MSWNQALSAISHLQSLGIAHRDVRSDNMLLDTKGILKLADFAHAVQTSPMKPVLCTDVVGVVHWQAPDIRQ
jgi:serine/threonine protein kinase